MSSFEQRKWADMSTAEVEGHAFRPVSGEARHTCTDGENWSGTQEKCPYCSPDRTT
jgi:hypothetical protein